MKNLSDRGESSDFLHFCLLREHSLKDYNKCHEKAYELLLWI